MRTAGYTVQQSLTAEAASMVKQAVSLARRRGHTQVTPLHVASAMLSSSTGLLRKACLQSHSHPLQFKALELCFNVALNRLPTSASSPILGPQSHLPSLSNALVAAFKRAQAHQRRGYIENQQQPVLAIKLELEQLVISILDDPSVSRVMREAGFSSTHVKANVEQAVSLEISSQGPSASRQSKESIKPLVFGNSVSHFLPMSQFSVSVKKPTDQVGIDDVMSVIDAMMSKKRKNTVIVGECLSNAEGVVRKVMDKFEKGDISSDLGFVQFVSVPLSSTRNLLREEVEEKLGPLKCLVKSYVGRGVVLYLGDLKWVSDYWPDYAKQRTSFYCPVEHMVMELSRLLCGVGESGKLWLMGIATFQTYMRCKTGCPSIETLWNLHPLTIPVGSLGLSLSLESDMDVHVKGKMPGDESGWLRKTGVENNLTCCPDCSANFTREAHSIASNACNIEFTTTSTSSSLPTWLQQYNKENRRKTVNDQVYDKVRDLCEKWNSICSSVHKKPHFLEKAIHFSLSSPSSSTSVSSHDRCGPKLHQSLLGWPVIFKNQSPKEHKFLASKNAAEGFESTLRTYISDAKPDLLSNPNSSPNSASSSEVSEMEALHGFKELNSENLKALCHALEEKVPQHMEIIPDIVSTVLHCRSGKMERKGKLKHKEVREETWLLFLGVDSKGKQRIARQLSKAVFGSKRNFVNVILSSFSLTRADSTEETSNKRARDEHGQSYFERFADAVRDNPNRVFFLEDVEQVDSHSQICIKKAIESGTIAHPGGELISMKDAIVIFSSESFSSVSRACSPPISQKSGEDGEKEEDVDLKEGRPCTGFDLNISTEDNRHGRSLAEAGILELVDKQVIFKIQVL